MGVRAWTCANVARTFHLYLCIHPWWRCRPSEQARPVCKTQVLQWDLISLQLGSLGTRAHKTSAPATPSSLSQGEETLHGVCCGTEWIPVEVVTAKNAPLVSRLFMEEQSVCCCMCHLGMDTALTDNAHNCSLNSRVFIDLSKMGKGKNHLSSLLMFTASIFLSAAFPCAFVSERCNILFQVGTEIVFLSPVLIANYVDASFALFPFKSVCLGPFHPRLWIRQQREYQTESWWKLRLPPVSSESVLIWFLILFLLLHPFDVLSSEAFLSSLPPLFYFTHLWASADFFKKGPWTRQVSIQ